MNVDELRARQAPLKDAYRQDPSKAQQTLRAVGVLDPEEVVCRVETSSGVAEAGLHEAAGGDGHWACSGDMLLQSLAACAGVTLAAVARALGIALRGGRVIAEGDLDWRGTLAVDKEAPVGFKDIRLRFELESEAGDEELETLQRLTERYCVVFQTLMASPTLSVSMERGQSTPG
jgi:uncharacterized OsmC-like protein